MPGEEYNYIPGDLARQDLYPDERKMQPPQDQPWPYQAQASPQDPQPWQAPPTDLARWPVDPSQMDASEAAAFRTQSRYRNALARDPTSNRLGDLAQTIAPQSPLDYALLASGPIAKAASVPVRAALYGGAMAMDPEAAQASFAGKLSRTANLDMMKKAEEMLQYGKSASDIRNETNWFPSAGGILKYEIPDRGSNWIKGMEPSKLKIPAGGQVSTSLGSAFNHPELYDAYPELGSLPLIVSKRLGADVRGGYMPALDAGGTPNVFLAPGSGKSMRDVTLHEVGGHAVQDIEGFPVGGNPGRPIVEGTPQWDIYQRMRADATAPMSEEEFIRMSKDVGIEPSEEAYGNYLKSAQNIKLMPSTEDRLKRMAAAEGYRRSAGEVDARNIQTRKDYTPEQIKFISPEASQDTPYDKQIIQYRDAPVAVPKEGAPWEMGSLADLSSNVTNFNEKKALSNIAKWQQGAREATYRPALAGEDLKAAIASDRELPLPANSNTGGMPRPEEPMGSLADQSMQLSTKDPGLTGFAPDKSAVGDLFDYSRIHEVPDVRQFDLPRYNPPRGVSERVDALTGNKKVQQQMLDYIDKGRDMNAETFYYNEPLRDAFVSELGKKKGPEAFSRYMDYVAATSPRSDVETNARNASYYYMLERQGLPVPPQGGVNPQPYGHMAQNLHRENAEKIRSGEYFDPIANPKPLSFSQNLQGNFAPVTVDAHAFKLPAMLSRNPDFLAGSLKLEKGEPTINPTQMYESGDLTMREAAKRPVYWAARPNKNEYGAMEQYYKRLADEAGMTPGQTQAAAWAGGGKVTGLGSVAGDPFMRAVENRAIKTAAERGITPAEALSQMMRGKAPLLGIGGAAAVGGLAAQDDYR